MTNPVLGPPYQMAVMVFPENTPAIALQLPGDAAPRWMLMADSFDGMYFGDGTDPGDHYPGAFQVHLTNDGPRPPMLALDGRQGLTVQPSAYTDDIQLADGAGGYWHLQINNDGSISTEAVT